MRLPAPVAVDSAGLLLSAAVLLGATGVLGGADDPTGALPSAGPPPAGAPRSIGDLTPATAQFPAARPRPTKQQADALAGAPVDLVAMRSKADELPALSADRTVGETGGDAYVDYVWGDVENYQSGQQAFDADDIAVRMIRRVGTGEQRKFLVVSFSARSGLTSQTRASFTDGGDRPDHYTYDLPDTAWAD